MKRLLILEAIVNLNHISTLIPQYNINYDLDIVPSLDEIKMAIKLMKSNSATGIDAVANFTYEIGTNLSLLFLKDIALFTFKKLLLTILF